MRTNGLVKEIGTILDAAKGEHNSRRFALPLRAIDPQGLYVSAVFGGRRGECCITSFECIYLLESLIAVRFTVEEKNRVRRNSESFRPLIVSKGGKDCESCFKLIKQSSSRKPSGIEKDVKVFSWSILSHALKKIVRIYVRTYTHTDPLYDALTNVCCSLQFTAPPPRPYLQLQELYLILAPSHEASHPRASKNMPPRATCTPSTVTDAIAPNVSSATATAMIEPDATLSGTATPRGSSSPANRVGPISDAPSAGHLDEVARHRQTTTRFQLPLPSTTKKRVGGTGKEKVEPFSDGNAGLGQDTVMYI